MLAEKGCPFVYSKRFGIIYVDYKAYISLLQHPSDPSKEYIHSLLDVIKHGAFLYHTEYDWLDNIKSEISGSVIDI